MLDYDEAIRDRIIVLAIAPGGYIYQESCAQVIHYRADAHRDFVPRIDRAGAKRAKGTIIDLVSHPNADRFDHSFISPTYERALQDGIERYINSRGQGI